MLGDFDPIATTLATAHWHGKNFRGPSMDQFRRNLAQILDMGCGRIVSVLTSYTVHL